MKGTMRARIFNLTCVWHPVLCDETCTHRCPVTKRADIAVATATSHTAHTARSQSVGLHYWYTIPDSSSPHVT